MRRLADLLKKHELVMDRCPEIIEIIEDLYIDVEKQQIEKAYNESWRLRDKPYLTALQYYNETYNI